jgi:hypothetical protein
MNAGFGPLIKLKRHVLKPALQAETTWDTLLQELGNGVAGSFDQHCNRRFARVVGDVLTVPGDRIVIGVPRYPVEAVTKVEVRADDSEAWQEETITDLISATRAESGVLILGNMVGDWRSQIRVTYTGGYWWETAETENTTMPTGATTLPGDLIAAWLVQCQAVWEKMDRLGKGLAGATTSDLMNLKLAPEVERMLAGYVRYAN